MKLRILLLIFLLLPAAGLVDVFMSMLKRELDNQ